MKKLKGEIDNINGVLSVKSDENKKKLEMEENNLFFKSSIFIFSFLVNKLFSSISSF
jgi:hypothetical protein